MASVEKLAQLPRCRQVSVVQFRPCRSQRRADDAAPSGPGERTGHCPGPCPVSERLAKQLSRKIFRFIRINWTALKRKIFCLANRSLTGHGQNVRRLPADRGCRWTGRCTVRVRRTLWVVALSGGRRARCRLYGTLMRGVVVADGGGSVDVVEDDELGIER